MPDFTGLNRAPVLLDCRTGVIVTLMHKSQYCYFFEVEKSCDIFQQDGIYKFFFKIPRVQMKFPTIRRAEKL